MADSGLTQWIRKTIRRQQAYRVKSVDYTVKLNQNESPWDWAGDLKKEITSRIVRVPWNRYPELIPQRLKSRLAIPLNVEQEQIVVGKGSNEVLQAIAAATLSEEDTVCTLSPTFAVYDMIAEQRGARVHTSLLNDKFEPDEKDLKEKAAKAKVTILCNPNSPTGTLIPVEVIERVADVSPGLVVVDEAYVDFSGVTTVPLVKDYPNLIVTRTFSKAFALAGFRLGYAVMNADLAVEVQKCLLPFNIDMPSAVAGEVLLDYTDLVAERAKKIVQERDWLLDRLNYIPSVKAWPSHANFFLLETPAGPAATFNGLAQRGVLVRDISSYPLCDNTVRVSVGTSEENQKLLEGVRDLL